MHGALVSKDREEMHWVKFSNRKQNKLAEFGNLGKLKSYVNFQPWTFGVMQKEKGSGYRSAGERGVDFKREVRRW